MKRLLSSKAAAAKDAAAALNANSGAVTADGQVELKTEFRRPLSKPPVDMDVPAEGQRTATQTSDSSLLGLEGMGVTPTPTRTARASDTNVPHRLSVPGPGGDKLTETFHPDELFVKYSQEATNGNPLAMLEVGKCFLNGKGVEVDTPSGISWVRRASQAGSSDALNMMGVLWDMGVAPNCEMSKNQKRAFFYYREAADCDNMDAITNLGFCYLTGNGVNEDGIEACRWLSRAARHGHPKAQLLLGKLYLTGKSGIDADPRAAMFYFQSAARKGETEANAHLGCCYQQGIGVLKDLNLAEKNFRIAADAGDMDAACELGLLLCMSERYIEALPYLVAALPSPEACYAIGRLHELGLGTPADPKRAVKSFRMGSESGHSGCAAALARLGEGHSSPAPQAAPLPSAGSPLITENGIIDSPDPRRDSIQGFPVAPPSSSSSEDDTGGGHDDVGSTPPRSEYFDAEGSTAHSTPAKQTEIRAAAEDALEEAINVGMTALRAADQPGPPMTPRASQSADKSTVAKAVADAAADDYNLSLGKILRKNISLRSETSDKGAQAPSPGSSDGPLEVRPSRGSSTGGRAGNFLQRTLSIPVKVPMPLKVRRMTDQASDLRAAGSLRSIKDGSPEDEDAGIESMRRLSVRRMSSQEQIKWPFLTREDTTQMKSTLNAVNLDNYRLSKELQDTKREAAQDRALAAAMETTVQSFWLRILALESQIRDLGADPFVPAEDTRDDLLEEVKAGIIDS